MKIPEEIKKQVEQKVWYRIVTVLYILLIVSLIGFSIFIGSITFVDFNPYTVNNGAVVICSDGSQYNIYNNIFNKIVKDDVSEDSAKEKCNPDTKNLPVFVDDKLCRENEFFRVIGRTEEESRQLREEREQRITACNERVEEVRYPIKVTSVEDNVIKKGSMTTAVVYAFLSFSIAVILSLFIIRVIKIIFAYIVLGIKPKSVKSLFAVSWLRGKKNREDQ